MTTPPQVENNSENIALDETFIDAGISIDELDLRDEISVQQHDRANSNTFNEATNLWKKILYSALVLFLIFTTAVFSEQVYYKNRILPGIEIGKSDFGGFSKNDAVNKLDKLAKKFLNSPFDIVLDGQEISVSSQDFDLKFENNKTIENAINFEKTFSPIDATKSFFSRHLARGKVTPIYTLDHAKFETVVQNISNQLSSGRVDAKIVVEATKVTVHEPISGTGVSATDVKKAITKSIESLSTDKIKFKNKNIDAQITSKEANKKADLIKDIYSSDTVLTTPLGNTITITPDQMSTALSVTASQSTLDINIDEAKLRTTLAAQLETVEIKPTDASFAVNGNSVSVIPSVSGKRIDINSAISKILKGEHSIAVNVSDDIPKHDTQWANALNITELVSTFTTNFPAGQIRVKNIAHAAEVVNNTVIEPNEIFSLNTKLGKRTAENGYFKAPVYIGGEDTFAEDFGGGISQFTTTLFNAAWIAGYKDISHTPHSIYISRYPKGREATLNYGSIDLKIQDDYKSGILIRTSVGPTSVTVSLYGNKEGRTVSLEGPNVLGETPIENKYTDDPTLPIGKEIQTDHGYPGITVENFRTIKRPGLPDKKDRLTWKYVMVPNKIRRGTMPEATTLAPS